MFEEEHTVYYKCRTCFDQTKNLKSLSMLFIDEPPEQVTYGEVLKEVTSINIMEDDPEIPQYICSCCSRKLKSSYAFIKQAQKSNDRFLSLLTERQNCMKESEIDIDQCLEVKMESDDEEDQQPNVNSANDVDDMQIKSELSDSHNSTEETKKESGSKTKVKEAKIRTEEVDVTTLSLQKDTDYSLSEREEEKELKSDPISIENTDSSPVQIKKEDDDSDIAAPCTMCNKIFKNSKDLRRHRRNVHISEDEKCSCPVCGLKFTRPCNMYKHMRVLHDQEAVKQKPTPAKEKTHQCPKCPRKYTHKKHLNGHIREKHSGKSDAENTKATEEPEANSKKKYEVRPLCSICGGSYATKADLIVHMRRHTGERPYKCDLCDKAFIRAFQLTCHRRLHTGEKPYKCKVCEKPFRVSTDLKAHMRSHSDERPYKCKHCDRSFKYYKGLTIHNRTHTGDKPLLEDWSYEWCT